MPKTKTIPDKWLYFSIIILSIYFIIRLIDTSKLIHYFPLDTTNDISNYMAHLYFLSKCGFHQICNYWDNGFILLKYYPPGWFFFTYPIYILTKNIPASSFLSAIILFIIGFIFIYLLGKNNNFSKTKIIALFLFLFANAIAIGDILRLGRFPELFGWISFLAFFYLISKYIDKKLDKKFLLIIPIYFILMISHQTVFLLSSFFLISLFLTRNTIKERIYLIFCFLISSLLSAFYWVPFLLNISNTRISKEPWGKVLFTLNPSWLLTNIVSFIIPIIFFVCFYYYWKSENKSKQILLFYSPILFISLLFFTRVVGFIPFINNIYPDIYNLLLIFLSTFFLFKTKLKTYPKNLRKIILISLLIIPLISVLVSAFYTPYFTVPGQLEEDTISLFPYVEGKFLMFESPSRTSYIYAYYSYAPIYYDLETSSGWSGQAGKTEYFNTMAKINQLFKEKNCEFKSLAKQYNTTSVITYNEHCNTLKKCNLKHIKTQNNVCLYKLK